MNSLKGRSSQALKFWTTLSLSALLVFTCAVVPVRNAEKASSLGITSALIISCSQMEGLYLDQAQETWVEGCSRRSTGFFEYKIRFDGEGPILLEVETSGSIVIEASLNGEPLKQYFESGQIDEDISVKMKRQLRLDASGGSPLRVRFSKKKGSSKPFALWKLYVRRGVEIYPGTPTEQAYLDSAGSSILLPGGGRGLSKGDEVKYKVNQAEAGPLGVVIESIGDMKVLLASGGAPEDVELMKSGEFTYGFMTANDLNSSIVLRATGELKIIRVSIYFGLSCMDFQTELSKMVFPGFGKEAILSVDEPIVFKLPPHADSIFWCQAENIASIKTEGLEIYSLSGCLFTKVPQSLNEVKLQGSGKLYSWGIDQDPDEDSLPSSFEMAYGTDADRAFTDFDEQNDYVDIMPLDTDNDGLDDDVERFLGINPSYYDSNSDGYPDSLGLSTPKLSPFCANITRKPWPGVLNQDVYDPQLVSQAIRFGDTNLIIPFGKILLDRDPVTGLKTWMGEAEGFTGVVLDYCAIKMADLSKPEMIDAFQIYAKRLWGNIETDDNLAYKAGMFCCNRIESFGKEAIKLAKEKGLKVAVTVPSPYSPDRAIVPYLLLKEFDRVTVIPPVFSSDQMGFYAGFKDAGIIGRGVYIYVSDEKTSRAYIAGVRESGFLLGTSVSENRPLSLPDKPVTAKTDFVQIITDSSVWAPQFDIQNQHPDWVLQLAQNGYFCRPSQMQDFIEAKEVFIDETTTFLTEDDLSTIKNWIEKGGNILFRLGDGRFKNEVWWGSRTSLGRIVAREFGLHEVGLGKVYKAGSGHIMLYDGDVSTGAALFFNELKEDAPKPSCQYCEAEKDQVEACFSWSKVEQAGEFPKNDYPITVPIADLKPPKIFVSTCAVPWIEKTDSKVRMLCQGPKGLCASVAIALGGAPLSSSSSTPFSFTVKGGITTISFVCSGGGDAFIFDLSEFLDLEVKQATVYPIKPNEGEAVTVDAYVENKSQIPSGPFTVAFYWNTKDRQNLFKRVQLDGLQPKTGKSISFLAPLPQGSGDMVLIASIESEGEVQLENNTKSFPFNVVPRTKYKTIVMQVGSYTATVDGEATQITSPPIQLKNGRVMVPFRFLAESLGATVAWDGDTKMVTFTKGKLVIFLWVGRDYAISGGTMVQLDAPPMIQGGRTYIPVRFVSEQLGAQVTWDGKNRIVTVKLKMD